MCLECSYDRGRLYKQCWKCQTSEEPLELVNDTGKSVLTAAIGPESFGTEKYFEISIDDKSFKLYPGDCEALAYRLNNFVNEIKESRIKI